jgi:hypothetical protein
VDEAVENLRNRLGIDAVDRLELEIRRRIIAPAGSLWKICADPNIPSDVLAEELSCGAARWVSERTIDTQTPEAMLQRHMTVGKESSSELKALREWSVPSVPGRAPAEKSVDQSPIETQFLVFLPDNEPSQELAEIIRMELSSLERPEFIGSDHQEVCFVRLARHASLGRMLPLRVLKGRVAFENLKQSNVVCDLFPAELTAR